jgi:ribosome-associated heat shock protein Hsp15
VSPQEALTRVRLDKWLWAARFFKTRSAATDAVHGGKAEVNGEPAKAARMLVPGDIVKLRVAPYEYVMVVTALADRRGSAEVAATLYKETAESLAIRERMAEQHRLAPDWGATSGKPDKKQRREIRKWKGD